MKKIITIVLTSIIVIGTGSKASAYCTMGSEKLPNTRKPLDVFKPTPVGVAIDILLSPTTANAPTLTPEDRRRGMEQQKRLEELRKNGPGYRPGEQRD